MEDEASTEMDEFLEEETSETDSAFEDRGFHKIKKKYNQTIAELGSDEQFTKFLGSYTRLFNYFQATREDAKELQDNREDLDDALAYNQDRLNDSLKVIDGDEHNMEDMKEEIDTSKKLIENAETREQLAQEVIDNLRKTIANLNAEIDVKNKMAQAELEENPQMAKHREMLEREKAKLISEVSKLSEKLNNALAYQEELERRTSLTDLRIADISTQLEETQVEVEKFKRIKEKLVTDITEFSDEVEQKDKEVEHLHTQMEVNYRMIAKYDAQLKEQSNFSQRCFRELHTWNMRCAQMQAEYDRLTVQAEDMRQENFNTIKLLHAKDEERLRLQMEVSKLSKQRDQIDHKARLIEVEKMNMIADKNKLTEIITGMQRDCEAYRLEAAANKEEIEEHVKERDILNRNLLRQQALTKDHQRVIRLQELARKRLNHEIDEHVIENRRQTKQIKAMMKERDRLIEDSINKTRRMEATMEEINMQNQYISDVRRLLEVNEARFKAKQSQLDVIRGEKHALQKLMQQGNAENHDMKERLKMNHRQSEQLKEGIGVKEILLIKEETIKRKILKERDNVKIELNTSLDWVRSLRKQIVETEAEELRLGKVIEESEKLMKDQVRAITVLITERDVLGSQLVRRNDEICLVRQKIELIRSTLVWGEAQYESRLNDIRLLKVEIKRIRQEAFLLKKSIGSLNDFKVSVFHLERELTLERMKSIALEEELHNPMNVHRWRRLSGTDPDLWDLLKKIALLQKRLINQANELVEVEKELREVESLYMNLRILSAQQPGANVQEDFNKVQKCLFQSSIHNKCLVSELNMLEINSRKCKKTLAKTIQQLQDVKDQLKLEKKKHAKERQAVIEGVMMMERLEGAVEMPPMSNDNVPSLSVSSLGIKKK